MKIIVFNSIYLPTTNLIQDSDPTNNNNEVAPIFFEDHRWSPNKRIDFS